MSSSSSLCPSISAAREAADQVLTWLGPAFLQDRFEVVDERLRCGQTAFRVDGEGQHRDRPALELREVLFRQPEQRGDDAGRVREGERLDQVGLTVRGEPVDQFVADAPDDLVFPTRQRLLGERLGHQRPEPAVYGFVHAQHHAVAQHVAEDLDHGVRRERLVVAQHLLDVLVPVHDEDGLALLARHRGHVDALDRRLVALLGQLRVRVSDVARDDVVERPEVLEVVEQI